MSKRGIQALLLAGAESIQRHREVVHPDLRHDDLLTGCFTATGTGCRGSRTSEDDPLAKVIASAWPLSIIPARHRVFLLTMRNRPWTQMRRALPPICIQRHSLAPYTRTFQTGRSGALAEVRAPVLRPRIREQGLGGRWHPSTGILSARSGTPSDAGVVGLVRGQAPGADPPEVFQPLAGSRHPVVRARKGVSITWPSGALRCADLLCQFGLTHQGCQSKLTGMDFEELSANLSSDDPAIGLRASLALHRLAERVEANQVASAREMGWSWQQIGDALGVTRQSVHTKYNKESS